MKLPKFLVKLPSDLYFHKFPFFMLYKPNLHEVKGPQVREVLNLIQDGDILARRYDGYMSTWFIPGFWSHVGLYYGDNVTHAAGNKGVYKEDVLTFCRTDSIAILRPKDQTLMSEAIRKAEMYLGVAYDFEFESDNENVYCSEFTDVCYSHMFNDDYTVVAGQRLVTPDGVFNSSKVELIYEFRG